jgi:hypothetical protein
MACAAPSLSWIGDGFCDHDLAYNNAACNWDGGDCCIETCVTAAATCGQNGYYCLNPLYFVSYAPTPAPTMAPVICPQFLSFDDAHGSYATWATSFLKIEGYYGVDDDFSYHKGYIPYSVAMSLTINAMTPAIVLNLQPGVGATFSVVAGKLDSNATLIPCELESEGSGPCFTSHSWEMGLTAKSFLNSIYSSESNAWIAPFGSSMSNECDSETEKLTFVDTRLRAAAFTGEGRGHNNVPPPSFHAPPPLPHESEEFSLTLVDGGGFGWWNTIKYHSNQYVLDDGEKIVHQGTLVGKAQTTEKVSSLPTFLLPSHLATPPLVSPR